MRFLWLTISAMRELVGWSATLSKQLACSCQRCSQFTASATLGMTACQSVENNFLQRLDLDPHSIQKYLPAKAPPSSLLCGHRRKEMKQRSLWSGTSFCFSGSTSPCACLVSRCSNVGRLCIHALGSDCTLVLTAALVLRSDQCDPWGMHG